MNVTKGVRRVPQFEDAYRDLFKHEVHKLPNRQMVALFDSFDNVIGRPFDLMTEAQKNISGTGWRYRPPSAGDYWEYACDSAKN